MFGIPVESLPALNAALNSLATICIVVALLAIRKRNERLHIGMMITALVFSAAFMTSYLAYHFSVGHKPTSFTGLAKTAYLIFLASHVILAAVIVPMVLATVWFAARNRRDRHRKWARRTAPLWLYVSVTGVMIWALNHVLPA